MYVFTLSCFKDKENVAGKIPGMIPHLPPRVIKKRYTSTCKQIRTGDDPRGDRNTFGTITY